MRPEGLQLDVWKARSGGGVLGKEASSPQLEGRWSSTVSSHSKSDHVKVFFHSGCCRRLLWHLKLCFVGLWCDGILTLINHPANKYASNVHRAVCKDMNCYWLGIYFCWSLPLTQLITIAFIAFVWRFLLRGEVISKMSTDSLLLHLYSDVGYLQLCRLLYTAVMKSHLQVVKVLHHVISLCNLQLY